MNPSQVPDEFFQKIPKVDLHRHLEGSVRFETIAELARSMKIDLPPLECLRALVQFNEGQPRTYQNLLAKFAILRRLFQSREIIQRIVWEAVEDGAKDNLVYLELRFTPVALSAVHGFPLEKTMDWVCQATETASAQFHLPVRLIASVNRHERVDLAGRIAALAAERKSAGIVALDLAGDEVNYPASPFIPTFQRAKASGLHVIVHSGEWSSRNEIIEAIELLSADRISHGVHLLESSEAVKVALEKGIVFEVCPSSNYQSGAVAQGEVHPFIKMLRYGIIVTLNTDNPGISKITLGDEYRLSVQLFGLSIEQLLGRILAATQAAFLPAEDKQKLRLSIQESYSNCLSQIPSG